MKAGLIGRHLESVRSLLRERGVETPAQGPWDFIVIHGGDGSLLGAERDYPGVPKLPIRNGEEAPLCPLHSAKAQIDGLLSGSLSKSVLPKIAGGANGRRLLGINDVFIHSRNTVSALRYKVWIDEELYASEIVGDGVGVSTVHGSTAYYRSITHSVFRVGIGMAFSNSTELVNHLVLPESSIIRFKISRGPAELVADNSPAPIALNEGDEAVVSMTGETAIIHGLDVFMCQECRRLRRVKRAHGSDAPQREGRP